MNLVHRFGIAKRSIWLPVLAFTLLAAPLPAADNPPPGADKEEATADRIAKLIDILGSDDFGAREKAQSELAQAGLEAYDALHAAQGHHDPEIALRARYLVRSMSVRWFAESDSPKVVAILKEYGDLQEGEKRSRIDRLAALEDRAGVTPLIRLARFETLDPLAKYAALQIMELPPPAADAAKAELTTNIGLVVGNSKRPAAAWLRLYARTLADPAGSLPDWDQATQAEHTVLEKTPDKSSREIVRDLYRLQVDLLDRLQDTDAASAVIRHTFSSSLIEGNAEQVQETVDWLTHREAWPLALELMQKFDATVQENAKLLYRLAGIYDSLHQPAQADEVAKKALALKPENFSEHLLMGQELKDTPRLARWAEAEFRQVIASAMPGSKPDFSARFSLSELLHDQLQELPAAELLKPVCDLLQKDENARLTSEQALRTAEGVIARMHYFYACHAHEQKNWAKEKEHLKLASDAYFKDADVLIAMYRLPEADEAWKAMTKERIELVTTEYLREVDEKRLLVEAAEGDPSRANALGYYAEYCNQYAWLVGNTFGDYQKAVKLSEESVKICRQLPEHKTAVPGFLDTLGRAYFGAGDVVNAAKYQGMAVALNPVSGQIRRQLEFFQKEASDHGITLPPPEAPEPPRGKSPPLPIPIAKPKAIPTRPAPPVNLPPSSPGEPRLK